MSPTWCVAPRFIVRGEDTEVAASYKLLIIHGQQRRGGREELWVEDNLKRAEANKDKSKVSECLTTVTVTGSNISHATP